MKNQLEKAEILLATYNGEKYLPELLNSLLSQSYPNLSIIVRDDGSTDASLNILQEYAVAHSEKFRIVADDLGNLGPMGNFGEIAAHSDARYIFFADQDDVWEKHKVEVCVKELKFLEEKSSTKTPCLVFSDMHIADEDLGVICPSYFEYCQKKPHKVRLQDLILQNIMLGCVQGFNRSLLELAFPMDKKVIMHDWWLGIIASALGRISYMNEPLIYYRQHPTNLIGARGPSLVTYRKMMPWADKTSYTHHLNLIFQQAEFFMENHFNRLSEEQRSMLRSFVGIREERFLGRFSSILRNGFFRNNIHETLEVIFRYSPKN